MIRTVRGRATVIAALTVAVVFGVGSWVTVRSLERALRSDITAENERVLDELAGQISSGADPRALQVPFGSDGTEFLILDADEQLVNSSFFAAAFEMAPAIVVEGENGGVGFVQDFSVPLSAAELDELSALSPTELTEADAEFLAELMGDAAIIDVNPTDAAGEFAVEAGGVAAGGVVMIEQSDWLETRRTVSDETGREFTLVGLSPIRIAERNIDRLVAVMTGLVPLLTLLGGGLAWWAAGVALSPVGRITDEANRIAPSNSGSRLPVPDSADEIATLATTLNEMLDRLDEGLTRQRQFVSDASHELRSPLTSVRGAAAILSSRTDLDGTVARNVELVERGAGRLESVLDDLTALATGAGDTTGERSPVDLADLILVEVDRAAALRPDVEIDTSRVEGLELEAVAVQISRAVANLLTNAVRHAERRIAVIARAVDGTGDGTVDDVPADVRRPAVEIVVDDDGPGVPPDHRRSIFERFVRLDDARSRDLGGSGLGLALVASIAQSHGGSVACEDSPLGGARFVVRLDAGGRPDAP